MLQGYVFLSFSLFLHALSLADLELSSSVVFSRGVCCTGEKFLVCHLAGERRQEKSLLFLVQSVVDSKEKDDENISFLLYKTRRQEVERAKKERREKEEREREQKR